MWTGLAPRFAPVFSSAENAEIDSLNTTLDSADSLLNSFDAQFRCH
jgi:hypothetical protein